jgi:diguanylate cyclase (GGDEF)-like protein
VRHLVADDPLTGLANRRVADSEAESALESGHETCIVMCDVDGLKRVNDDMGHDAGDDLLRSVADVLSRAADALPGSGRNSCTMTQPALVLSR